MKKRMLALLLGLLCAGLTACGSTDTAAKDETPSAPSVEQPEPEPTPEEVRRTAAEQYADGLTLEEQVAQMFFVRCPETDAAALTAQYDIGGYLLFARDFDGQTNESVANTIAAYQNAAKTPMLIGADEEGGTVVRVSSNPNLRGTKFQSPQALYREGGFDRITSDTAEKDALLRDLGINVNFAPVCDVSTDPSDFIYARSFGMDAEQTGEYVRTVGTQMVSDKTGMVLKHFPGYGSATVDDHNGTSIVEMTLSELEGCDLVPFQSIISSEGSVPFVMVSHLSYPNVTGSDTPADLSASIVTDILRDKLEYQNVIITDSHSMASITDHYSAGDAAVKALEAGCDMILMPSELQAAFDAVKAAVADGTLSQARIDESVLRILTVIAVYCIIS